MNALEVEESIEPMTAEEKLALATEALNVIESALIELPVVQQRQVGSRLWKAIYERDWQQQGFLPLTDLAFRLDTPVGGS